MGAGEAAEQSAERNRWYGRAEGLLTAARFIEDFGADRTGGMQADLKAAAELLEQAEAAASAKQQRSRTIAQTRRDD